MNNNANFQMQRLNRETNRAVISSIIFFFFFDPIIVLGQTCLHDTLFTLFFMLVTSQIIWLASLYEWNFDKKKLEENNYRKKLIEAKIRFTLLSKCYWPDCRDISVANSLLFPIWEIFQNPTARSCVITAPEYITTLNWSLRVKTTKKQRKVHYGLNFSSLCDVNWYMKLTHTGVHDVILCDVNIS